MSEPVEPINVLYGWIELVDCSVLFNPNAVTADILALTEEDPYWESDGILWNEDNTVILGLELFRWNQPAPEVAEFLYPVTRHLLADEYLTFECKFRLGQLNSTLIVALASSTGVYVADGGNLAKGIWKLANTGRTLPSEEDEDLIL